MIKNFKHMWKHHRGFCLLTGSYLVPAMVTYIFTFDRALAINVGSVGILASFYFIWKYA